MLRQLSVIGSSTPLKLAVKLGFENSKIPKFLCGQSISPPRVDIWTRSYSVTNDIKKTSNPSVLDLQVGYISNVERHPNADKLYVLKVIINDNEDEILNGLSVCSGLVNLIPIEQLQGRRIVLLRNLKKSKMRGIVSEAMLLAASSNSSDGINEIVELVNPPETSKIGDKLFFEGYQPKPDTVFKKLTPKHAAWSVFDNIKTEENLNVVYLTNPEEEIKSRLVSENGSVATVNSLKNASVR